MWTESGSPARLLSRTETEAILNQLLTAASQLDGFEALSAFLGSHTMVLVAVAKPLGSTVTVGVEYEPRYESRARDGRSRLRSVLGFRPFTFRFEAPLLRLAQDYTLTLEGPPNHYVRYSAIVEEADRDETSTRRSRRLRRQQVTVVVTRFTLAPVRPGPNVSGYLSMPQTAQSSIAVLDGSQVDTPKTLFPLVVFNERTPGSLGQSTIFGLLCFVALLSAWIAYAAIVRQSGIDAESVILLLGVPGTLALWMRPPVQSERLVDPPLLSRAALALSGLLCFVAAFAIFLADASHERCDLAQAQSPTESVPSLDPAQAQTPTESVPSLDPECEILNPVTRIGNQRLTVGLFDWFAISIRPRDVVLASTIVSGLLFLMLGVRLVAAVRHYQRALRGHNPERLPKGFVEDIP